MSNLHVAEGAGWLSNNRVHRWNAFDAMNSAPEVSGFSLQPAVAASVLQLGI